MKNFLKESEEIKEKVRIAKEIKNLLKCRGYSLEPQEIHVLASKCYGSDYKVVLTDNPYVAEGYLKKGKVSGSEGGKLFYDHSIIYIDREDVNPAFSIFYNKVDEGSYYRHGKLEGYNNTEKKAGLFDINKKLFINFEEKIVDEKLESYEKVLAIYIPSQKYSLLDFLSKDEIKIAKEYELGGAMKESLGKIEVEQEHVEKDEKIKESILIDFVLKDGEILSFKLNKSAKDFIEDFEMFLNDRESCFYTVWCEVNGGFCIPKEGLKYFEIINEGMERS